MWESEGNPTRTLQAKNKTYALEKTRTHKCLVLISIQKHSFSDHKIDFICNITEESPQLCLRILCKASGNSNILNYKMDSFLIIKSPISCGNFNLLLQKVRDNFFRSSIYWSLLFYSSKYNSHQSYNGWQHSPRLTNWLLTK